MAGRPKKMVEKIEEFERRTAILAAELFIKVPEQYRKSTTTSDPLSMAWKKSIDATLRASNALEALGDMLRKKAGISRLSPAEEFFNGDILKTLIPPNEDAIPRVEKLVPAGETAER